MADIPQRKTGDGADGGARWNPAMAAAIVGGAVAATAGAVFGARALKRRNADGSGELNAVMETAITASEVAGAPKGQNAP